MINYENLLPAHKKAIEDKSFGYQKGYLVCTIHDLKEEMETCSQEDDYVADLNKEVNRLNAVLYQICKAERESYYFSGEPVVYIAEKDVDAKEVENEY